MSVLDPRPPSWHSAVAAAAAAAAALSMRRRRGVLCCAVCVCARLFAQAFHVLEKHADKRGKCKIPRKIVGAFVSTEKCFQKMSLGLGFASHLPAGSRLRQIFDKDEQQLSSKNR